MTDPDQEDSKQNQDNLPIRQLESKLAPIGRVLGYLILWWIGVSIASSFAFPLVADLRATDLRFLAAVAIPNALATVLITTGFVKYVDQRPVETLGLNRRGSWLAEFGFGTLLGVVLIGIVFLIALAAGWADIAGSVFQRSPGAIAVVVLQTLVVMAGIAVTEEVAIRGYILQNLRNGYGAVAALAVSSVFFGLLHFANPGAGLTALGGTLAAGLVLGYAYLATDRLWLPIGLHFGWNFALGPIFGFPVSGIDVPSWLVQRGTGPALWTGGSFGPEAGVLGLVMLILGAFAIYWFRSHWYRPGKAALEIAEAPPEDEVEDGRRAA